MFAFAVRRFPAKSDPMTDWEQHYLDDHTPWDKGEPSPGLLQFLAKAPLTGQILVPGCGLGHDVRAIASASPAAEVVGLDVAPSAIRGARELSQLPNETYVEGDFFRLPAEYVGAFDWIWEHTCFCAIDPEMRGGYVQAVRRVLKPSGQLLGVFYLDPYDEEHCREDGRPPFGCTVDELESRFGPSFQIVDSWSPTATYEGREEREWMMLLKA